MKQNQEVSHIPEKDRVLARRIVPGAAAHIFMLAILLSLSSQFRSWQTPATWVAATLLFFNLVRLAMGRTQTSFYPLHSLLWRRTFLTLTFATALGWGLLAVFALRDSGPFSHLFIYMLLALAGISVGGVSSLSPNPILARIFLILVFLPPTSHLLLEGGTEPLALSGLITFYVTFLWAQISVQGREHQISRQALGHYRAIAEVSGEGIAIHQDGKIVECNRTFAEMMGYAPDEILGMDLRQFGDPEEFKIVAKHIAAGSADLYEVTAFRKDGSKLPVEMCGIHCEWDGRPARAARVRDLTNQKRLESSLMSAKEIAEEEVSRKIVELETAVRQISESEHRLSSIIYQSPFATQIYSADGRVKKVNNAFKELWGLTHDQIENHVLANYNLFEDAQLAKLGMMPFIHRAFKGEQIMIPATLYQPAEAAGPGRDRWIETYLSPVKRADGSVSELVIIANDVTARMKADILLREQQSQIEAILDNSPAVIFMKDTDGRYLLVNRQFETLFKMGRKDVEGRTDFEFRDVSVADLVRESDAIVMKTGESVRREETLPIGDRHLTYMTIKFPVYDAHGKMRGICGIATDITDHKRANDERARLEVREKAALETSRLKSEFLATMSHEIRTPINGVMGMAQLLATTLMTSEQREYSEAILRSGESLLTVINDILDFSKIEAGKIEFEQVDFCIEDPIYDVVRNLNVEAKKKGIQLTLDLGSGLPSVLQGDPGRFTQVLNNLLGNAVKFTSEGHVLIRIRRNEAVRHAVEILVDVEDTGVGIEAVAVERLFKPFTQADASTTRRFGGTGLGLSIAKSLVEKMNGKIGVHSEVGVGSTFWFSVQFREATKSSQPTTIIPLPSLVLAPPLGRSRVLIAEDNPVNQIIAIRMVEKMGHTAIAVANGKECIETLRNDHFDLVLMDVQMPEMDGLEATRAIRKDARLCGIPIVALTANAIKGDSEICLASGMNDYLSKPVTAERLGAMVSKWIGTDGLRLAK